MNISESIKKLDVLTDELIQAVSHHDYDLCNELENKRVNLINLLLERKLEIAQYQKEELNIIINKQLMATREIDLIKNEIADKFKDLVVKGKMINKYKQWDGK